MKGFAAFVVAVLALGGAGCSGDDDDEQAAEGRLTPKPAGDPASFLKTKLRPLLVRLDEFRPRLEGLYLAVLDTRRRVALEWGSWTRNPAGSYWVRRDLAECSPIRQSDPPGTEAPPRCPV